MYVTADGAAIAGASMSLIVTVCVPVACRPPASVAVHVTVVTPFGKLLGASFENVTPMQLSVAMGYPRGVFDKARVHWPASVPKVTGPGKMRAGAGLLAVTVNNT